MAKVVARRGRRPGKIRGNGRKDVQLELPLARTRGGRRLGAGRKAGGSGASRAAGAQGATSGARHASGKRAIAELAGAGVVFRGSTVHQQGLEGVVSGAALLRAARSRASRRRGG